MHHELLAIERQSMLEHIRKLETMLETMQEDFGRCARGTTPCLFCANDDACVQARYQGCNFVWKNHN